MAKKHRIVMVNEAHHISQHRVLTNRLLKRLWKEGFRYFAVETLTKTASQQIDSGYISTKSGYYTKEPLYANLLLEAKKMGFKVVSYDYKKSSSTKEREILAAQIIHDKVFANDDKAKVLIHCGYNHIKESGHWLANQLKQVTGFDTLTINQTDLREKSNSELENPVYELVNLKIKDDFPVVLIDKNFNAWSPMPKQYDVVVFWPRTQFKFGRPTWSSLNRSPYEIKENWCKNNYPCMVEVLNLGLDDEVPLDRIVLHSKSDSKSVFLSKGKNIIMSRSLMGKIIHKKDVNLL